LYKDRMIAAIVATLLATPHVVATIPTGASPCGAAAGFGAVWVANDTSGTLARVDPRTNRVTRRFATGQGACSVAAGAGAVWVVNYKANALLRVDAQTLRIRTVRVDATPFDVLVAFGRVWVTAWEDGLLDEVDPATLAVRRRIDVGPRPVGLAARHGAVWVGFGREATAIARVDPATATVTRFTVGAARPGWFAAGTADLWIQAADSDLLHVDPASGKVLAHLHVGRTLTQGAAAPDGTIWVPDKEQSLVYRIDPVRQRVVDSFPAGPGAYFALRAFGSMWVLSYAGSDVRRFR
jgi:streptogramin lyase